MGGSDNFKKNLGYVEVKKENMGHAGLGEAHSVIVNDNFSQWTFAHEVAHAWDGVNGWSLSRGLQTATGGFTSSVLGWIKQELNYCSGNSYAPGCNYAGYFYGDKPPKGSDANFNRLEDFAESVTTYLYPDLARTSVDTFLVEKAKADLLYYPDYSTTKRWQYVDEIFSQ